MLLQSVGKSFESYFMDENKDSLMDIKSSLSLSEAANILGFASFRQVNALIKKGLLDSFISKWSTRKRVCKKQVEELSKLEKINK